MYNKVLPPAVECPKPVSGVKAVGSVNADSSLVAAPSVLSITNTVL